MRITRTHAAAFFGAMALALAAPQLSAQTQPRPAPPAEVVPPVVERPTAVPPDRRTVDEQLRDQMRDLQDDTVTYRYARPVVRVGQNYTLKQGEEVREVRTVFGDLQIDGHVTGDVVGVLGSVHLGSTAVIDNALVVVGGTLTIDDGAKVNGDMVVAAGSLNAPATFSPAGDHIVVGMPGLGPALHGIVPWITRGLLWGRLIVPGLGWIWVAVGVVFLLGLLLNTLFDRAVANTADVIVQRPLSAFLLGLLVAILTMPVIAILAATVIGLIVVPFVICALVLASMIGKVAITRAIGRGILHPELPEQRLQAFAAYVVGFAVLVFVYMVPIIGVLTWALTGIIGLGAAASTFRAGLRREQPPAPPAPVVAPPPVAPPPLVDVAGETPYVPSSTAFVEPSPAVSQAVPPPVPPLAAAGDLALYPRAMFLDRLAAFAVDAILVAIVARFMSIDDHDGLFALLLLIYHIAFWMWKGTTLGGVVVALRVTRTTGQDLRPIDAVVRGLSGTLSIAALGIGCFWMINDPEKQMWHDKIAGTYVVKVPRELALP